MENTEGFLHQETYATLFSVANKLQVEGDKYLENLTSRQLMVMISIVHLPEDEVTISAIGKKTATSKQNIKQIINIMERKGYVILKQSQKDKRAYNIQITESGKEVTMESYISSNTFYENLFKNFTANEMSMFLTYLKKLYAFDGNGLDGYEKDTAFN